MRLSPRPRFGRRLVAITNSEQPLITAVEVGDASAHDGSHAKELIDQQPEESRPERILGDSAYGDQQTREDMQQRGVEVLARVPEGEVREERIGKREFQIDLEAATVTCPQAHVVAIPQQARRDDERVVNFGAKHCNDCPLKSRCAPRAREKIQRPVGNPGGLPTVTDYYCYFGPLK